VRLWIVGGAVLVILAAVLILLHFVPNPWRGNEMILTMIDMKLYEKGLFGVHWGLTRYLCLGIALALAGGCSIVIGIRGHRKRIARS